MTQALKTLEINRGIEEFKKTPNAVLFDVRRPEEYAQGRIAGSKNVPVQMAAKILEQVPDKETPLYVDFIVIQGRYQLVATYTRYGVIA